MSRILKEGLAHRSDSPTFRQGSRSVPRSLAAALLALLLPVAAGADQNPLVELGTAFTGRPYVLDGNLVMESDGLHEVLRRMDDPLRPTLLGWIDHSQSGYYGEVSYRDGLMLAVHEGSQGGFELVDLVDPTSPEPLSVVNGTSFTSGWLGEGAVIVATAEFCIAYDIDDPRAPEFAAVELLGDVSGSRWFSELGSILYLVDHGSTLRGFDLSSAPALVDVGTADLDLESIAAMVAGDGVLHVLGSRAADVGGDEVVLLTLAETGSLDPVVVAENVLDSGPGARGRALARDGDLLLVALDDGTVHGLSLASPAQPTAVFTLAHLADHLAIGHQALYVLAADRLHIYARPAGGQTPEHLVSRQVLPRIRNVIGDGPVVLAQLHDDPTQLVPVDVTNPQRPRLFEPVALGFGQHLAHDDDRLIVSDGTTRFDIWDVSDPVAPVRLRSVRDTESRLNRARLAGNTLVFDGLDGVANILYDLTDPLRPRRGIGIATNSARAVGETLMLTGGGNRLGLFDIADVERPKWAAPVVLNGNAAAAAFAGPWLYIVVERWPGEVSLRVISVADPTTPQELASLPLPSLASVLVARGPRLFAQSYNQTIVIDISEPLAPSLVGTFPSWGQSGRGLAFHGSTIVNSGWLICLRDETLDHAAVGESPGVTAASLAAPYPNPFNPATTLAFAVDRPGHYTLTVHDVAGREIARLHDGPLGAGEHERTWLGRDHRGRPVASGVYLVRLGGGTVEAIRTVTLIK